MSKLIRIAVATMLVAALATVVGTAQAPAQVKSKGTIAFLLSGPDLYYQYGLNGAKAAAMKLGYDLKVFPNPNISPSVELANVRNAIAQGAKAITGYSVGLSTEDAAISAAERSSRTRSFPTAAKAMVSRACAATCASDGRKTSSTTCAANYWPTRSAAGCCFPTSR